MKTELHRQPLLDVFRGFAIFGIFVVNITIMHSVLMYQDAYLSQFQDAVSVFITKVLQLFFYNKFFPIFSFLFGLGLSMQLQSRIKAGRKYTGFFVRRMALLFLFGFAHISLFWSGDVLHLYAVLGLFSLLLIRANSKVLVGSAIVLLIFPYYEHGAMWFAALFSPGLESALLAYSSGGVSEVLNKGSYLSTMVLRADEYAANLPMLLFYLAPMALAMFLLGIAAGQNRVRFASTAWLEQTKKLAMIILVITTLYRVLFLWFLPGTELYSNEVLRPVWFKLMFLSDVTFGLFYLWVITWVWHQTTVAKLLIPFSFVGRMALTNYLMQSVIGLVLFTNIGFSLYQSLNPLQCFTLAMLCFVGQVLFSKFWLSHFQYGPLEWLWRCGSYMTMVPLRKENAAEGLIEKRG